jgi:periplasmic divalent cation tolerance protein
VPERYVVLLVTAATRDEAERMGEGLIEAGLASRGSVVPTIHSFYKQEGKLERGHEALLIITTSPGHAGQARKHIRENHSFEEPHIITLQSEA